MSHTSDDEGEPTPRTRISIVDQERVPVDSSVKINGAAGAGKTTQAEERLDEYARQRGGLSLGNLCAISYRRDKGHQLANELAAHDAFEGDETTWLGTIHAVARRLLDAEGHSTSLASYRRQGFCTGELGIDYYGSGDDPGPGELLFKIRDWLMEQLIDIKRVNECPYYEQFDELYGYEPHVVEFIDEWAVYKSEHSVHDYDDWLRSVLVFELVPDVEVLYVDEIHDAYPLMMEVLDFWMDAIQNEGGVVIVTGDPMQVVNSYQGAATETFHDIDLPEVFLPDTWRVPEQHWMLATDVLSVAHDPPKLTPQTSDGTLAVRSVEYRMHADGDPPDAPQGISTPETLLEDALAATDTETVLLEASTTYQLKPIAEYLLRAGYLFTGSSRSRAWTHENNQTTHRLRLYNALQKLAKYDPEDFAEPDGDVLSPYHGDYANEPLRLAEAATVLGHVPSEATFADGPLSVQDLRSEPEQTFIPMREFSRYLTIEASRALVGDAPLEFLDSASINEAVGELLGVQYLQAALERNENVFDPHQANIALRTFHGAKGQEADHVICFDGITSKTREGYDNFGSEEWREVHRVWYVALTRSKKHLTIVRDAFSFTESFLEEGMWI
ncbi:3'-5' exonuclease [Halomarina salina]|uniref:3'-5' exonuclease n=1 Tax=Halomarina salina TaxID=1872699 RepID=A0ABD5RQM7_9EURY|nr:3'-5' exonuclease [Halomarina salina]